MLRGLVLLLALANVLFWGETHGWWHLLGLPLPEQREPQRLALQTQPEQLQLRPPVSEAPVPVEPPSVAATEPPVAPETSPDAPASAQPPPPVPPTPEPPPKPTPPVAASNKPQPTACWQTSGFSAAQAIALNAALQNQAELKQRWTLSETVLPARWIVYLGKIANVDALQSRKEELKQAKVAFRDVTTPPLAPGLALGTYSTEAAAQKALEDVVWAGVRGARVVQERAESRNFSLKLPAITEPQRRLVDELPALTGKKLQRCTS